MPFDSSDLNLGGMLEDVHLGKIQLPDFQREWKWGRSAHRQLPGHNHARLSIGVVMMLETGGQDVNFAPKRFAGADGTTVHEPEPGPA